MAGMGDSGLAEGLAFPQVAGLYEDEEILFIHNASSDADIANLLTNMMGSSPVILRRVVTVTWADPAAATVLTNAAAVGAAEVDGRVALEETDIVVSMPVLRWPNGER